MVLIPIDDAIDRMIVDYEHQADRLLTIESLSDRYPLLMEPPSALFCDAMAVTVTGYRAPNNPLDVEVISDVYAHWTPQALKVLDSLRSKGLDPALFARSGAPYQTGFQNKKKKRAVKQRDMLTLDQAFYIYTTPYYRPDQLVEMMGDYKEQAVYNILQLDEQPDLLLVGKPPSTGTGWRSPWNDRQRMADHWSSISPIMKDAVPRYYDELMSAVANWPKRGSRIIGPRDFNGIMAGSRSDADVTEWYSTNVRRVNGYDYADDAATMTPSANSGFIQLASKTREVGNDPSSVLFGRGTTSSDWTQQMWRKYSSEFHVFPFEPGVIESFLTTPPATMRGLDDDAFVLLGADFGYQDHAPYVEGGNLVIPNPGRTFGADNIVLQGISVATGNDRNVYMLTSGAPFTMMQYLVTAGDVIANIARQMGLDSSDLQILQVGDDLNMRIRRAYVGPLLDAFGRYLKLKGMIHEGNYDAVFILGHYALWNGPDDFTAFVQPRAVKSVSSANMVGKLVPDVPVVGRTYVLRPSAEALAAAADLAARVPSFLYYEGNPQDWLAAMQRDGTFYKAKLAMAADGYSDYLTDLLQTTVVAYDTDPDHDPAVADDTVVVSAAALANSSHNLNRDSEDVVSDSDSVADQAVDELEQTSASRDVVGGDHMNVLTTNRVLPAPPGPTGSTDITVSTGLDICVSDPEVREIAQDLLDAYGFSNLDVRLHESMKEGFLNGDTALDAESSDLTVYQRGRKLANWIRDQLTIDE